MSSYEADELWRAFQTDPVGTYEAIGHQLTQAGMRPDDPRLAEMYDEFTRQRNLAAYDAEIERIISDPANGDINPNRLHTYVAAADGDFERAVQMYRADTAQIVADYRLAPVEPAPRDYRAEGLSPQEALHRAIEDATAARRGR